MVKESAVEEELIKFGDIDIDVKDRDQVLELIKHVPASIIKQELEPHKTGIYIQPVPTDPVTGLCSLDYQQAEELGYLKLDIINMYAYEGIRDEQHLNELISKPVTWELLESKEVVDQLYHIHNHFDIVSKMKPTSIEQLAAVLALIRPGKRHLIGKPWDLVEQEIWKTTQDGYSFKKSHAMSYALMIVVQINFIEEKLIAGIEDK